eukprot:CAMPEP_0198201338 /NCGR_PEP_ID=MMETSP1445-20131203/4092_1 /TAXON_ID=36898 /ORGANISM="Pyramimonas sp., Strain CCMP2087" /LENGTH=464 /DNA_ID=CAMNT_0043871593 /DNA_START=383 /DNA_END=1774 /DNA_ORIENTATION=+
MADAKGTTTAVVTAIKASPEVDKASADNNNIPGGRKDGATVPGDASGAVKTKTEEGKIKEAAGNSNFNRSDVPKGDGKPTVSGEKENPIGSGTGSGGAATNPIPKVTESEKKALKKDGNKDVKDGKKKVEPILTAEEEKLSPEVKEALKIKREDEKILQGVEIRANNDAFETCGGKESPPAAEPPVMRCHWDYVLVEMKWLAIDFAGERLWKGHSASQIARLAAAAAREPNFGLRKTGNESEKPSEVKSDNKAEASTTSKNAETKPTGGKSDGLLKKGGSAKDEPDKDSKPAKGDGLDDAMDVDVDTPADGDKANSKRDADGEGVADDKQSAKPKSEKQVAPEGPGTPPLNDESFYNLSYFCEDDWTEMFSTKVEAAETQQMEQAERRLRDWEDLQSHTMKELALAKSEEAMMAVEKAAQERLRGRDGSPGADGLSPDGISPSKKGKRNKKGRKGMFGVPVDGM